ncbi:hypothetical protein LP52_03945 [Streptomonospora alba]|uniref:Uncharacterized protein n=1 Tax=Streptomonospora alba TaxID=183763 RepID=A0A0C2JTC5_9ACTN|nr:hypothetical protein [Streptomonospora alba]KII00083.1 hypothetical protein LP52_03945 [Streptomonospora alba]
MDATTGSGPLHGLDDIDWSGLAPRGDEIPALLRDIAGGENAQRGVDEAVASLFDRIRFPGPGYIAAPRVAEFLVSIACHPDTPPDWRSRPLSLLLELLAPVATALVPERVDEALWRDEVSWAVATDIDKVREQYRSRVHEAPDEQQFRRMRARLDAVARDEGAALLQAELDVYDTVLARSGDLLTLLEGRDNRRGIDPPAEWACYVLAFLPGAAAEVCPVLLQRVGRPADLARGSAPAPPPSPLAAAGAAASSPSSDLLSAEIFALGMLGATDDPAATVALAHEMASGHLYNSFTAAVATVQIHGEKAPEECLTRIANGERTRPGYRGLFGDGWPHCGETPPEALGFLALGRAGARGTDERIAALPAALADSEGATLAAVTGAALETVLGPRTSAEEAVDLSAELDEDTLKVLWELAEVSEQAWEGAELGETVGAWGLPESREEFRAFTGADDSEAESDDDSAAQAGGGDAAQAAGPPQGGLLARLFGGR